MTRERLRAVLDEARAVGYLGPGDPASHIVHAEGFLAVTEARLGGPPDSFADLGTGGGVPGLVLAVAWTGATGTLVETSARRCASLRTWVGALGLADRVSVVEGRAEELAHEPAHRERYHLVTARGFAPPATTAEVAAGFASVPGLLVVSEPPGGDPQRWSSDRLAVLGWAPADVVTIGAASYAALRKDARADAVYPRRRGRAWKRPLW